MKKKNWYRGLSLADDKYIAEASCNGLSKCTLAARRESVYGDDNLMFLIRLHWALYLQMKREWYIRLAAR